MESLPGSTATVVVTPEIEVGLKFTGPRPALAPADPKVLKKIKGWAEAILGGAPLQLLIGGEIQTIEIYVRQMACRKPDCVPLETIIVMLGPGWHDKLDVLKAADEVSQGEVEEAARTLWSKASSRVPPSVDLSIPPPPTQNGGAGMELAAIEAQLFEAKPVADGMPIILPRDITEFSFSEDEVYVVGTNGRKVTVIAGLEYLASSLTTLILRSHVISRMENLATLVHLKKLELYDNQIDELEQLEHLKQLVVLDMSYNSVRSMAPVANCPLLEEIYLAQNKLRSIEGLEGLSHLRKLDVGGNRIRSLEPVAHCTALEELWAGKNKVEAIDGSLLNLHSLKRLDVQYNRLTVINGLGPANPIEELYLARNGIASLGDGLKDLSSLHTIDISGNRLTSLDGLQCCECLEEVWASANQISDLEDVRVLTSLSALTCVYLEHNPVATQLPDYRGSLAALLPNLQQIDATRV